MKSLAEALALAEEEGLDLVEVAPKANPPVCKILDYGKYLYKQSKQDQKQKRSQKKNEMKGVRLTFRINDHDLQTKIRQTEKFLKKNNSVKVTMMFKGREAVYTDLAKDKLDLFYKSLQDIAHMELPPKKQGNTMFMILVPLK